MIVIFTEKLEALINYINFFNKNTIFMVPSFPYLYSICPKITKSSKTRQ